MNRLDGSQQEIQQFFDEVSQASGMNEAKMAQFIGFSVRSLRDWRRGKYLPAYEALAKLSERSGVPLPQGKVLSPYWYVSKGARSGGKRVIEL